MLEIKSRNKKIKNKDLNKFENINNIKLEKSYRDFLIKFNGGIPERNKYNLFDSYGKPYWIEVEYFYSLEELEIHKNCPLCIDYNHNFIFIGKFNVLNIENDDKENKLAINLDDNTVRVFEYHDDTFNYDLLANNFDIFINSFSPRYENEFHKLCEINDIQGLIRLINSNLDLKLIDSKGNTSLRYIIFEIYIKTLQYNLDNQIELLDIIKMLLDKGLYEKGLFSDICLIGDYKLAKVFFDFGVNVNELGKNNFSPLISSVISNSPEIVKLLLENKADLSIKSDFNMTALDYVKDDLEYYKDANNDNKYSKEIYELLNNYLKYS